MRKILLALGVSALALITPSLIFAGGGLVSTEVTLSNGGQNINVSLGEQFIVRPTVHLNNEDSYDPTIRWCKGCPIKVKLQNPQSTDVINQSSDKTDENGTLYAKVISYIPGPRYVYSEVILPDGTLYTGSIYSLNYAGQAQAEPSFMPVVQKKEPNPSTTSTIKPTPPANVTKIETNTKVTKASASASLEQKVASLEKQLTESEQKRSALELKVDQLISFIKSIFPFF